MIGYAFTPVWAALEIGFALVFLGTFLKPVRQKKTDLWIIIAAWILTAAYGLLQVEGLHGYMMYILSAVLILLTVYGEYGPKGSCLLIFTFLIPVAVDTIVLHLAAKLSSIGHHLTVTAGKTLPILLTLGLRRSGKLPVGKRDQPDGETLLLRQHMELQRESMTALEANYRTQRKSAHEFEHHLQVLRDLMDRGQVDAARDHLDRLKKDRSICVYSVNSNHPVIDAILNQKYQTARESDIRMQVRVNDLSAVTVPTESLVVVLTNLLDNAIEACRRLDGYREIVCSILHEEGLYISIRNTSDPVRIVDGKIPTSKQDSLSHGFGLMSVGYVLDKFDAEYTFGYDEGWFHFAAEIE